MTEAQEKNHTDRVPLSPRMPRGQLMWQAVTYTHQGGAGGTNPLCPPEKILVIFRSPHVKRHSPTDLNYTLTLCGKMHSI